MRNLFFFFALFFLGISFSEAQDCTFYFPIREGAELEMNHFNGRDKLVSTTAYKVLKKRGTASELSIDVEVRVLDAGGKEEMRKTTSMHCKNGVFMMDMSSLIPDNLKGMEGMEIKISGSDMAMPGKPAVGQKLPDADMEIRVESNGMTVMTMNFSILNRKVEAKEDVTTPAGTFSCYRISQDMETTGMFSVRSRMIHWLAVDVGTVRTENYNKDNKLESYSILSKIKK